MRNKWVTVLVSLATAVFIIGVAVAPVAWFAAQDETLLAQPMQRLRLDGRLAPEGEDLYMVRTLHARSSLLRQNGAAAGYQPQPFSEEMRARAFLVLDEMAKAGVLPPQVHSSLRQQMVGEAVERQATTNGEAEWRYAVDEAGFEQVQCLFPADSGHFAGFGIEIEPRTRKAVRFWLLPVAGRGEALEGIESKNCLEAYLQWLELDTLDDWRAPAPLAYDAQMASQKALLQVYTEVSVIFQLGVTVLASGE